MLGVATLIVVNSVMGGFSAKLRERLHGLLSDVVLEAYDYNGFPNPEGKMALIRSDPYLDPRIEAMAPTLEIFAMLQFTYAERQVPIARAVRLIGVEPESRSRLGGFAEFLVLNKNRARFELSPEAKRRNREREGLHLAPDPDLDPMLADEPPPPEPPPSREFVPENAIVGFALAHYRRKDARPGEEKDICLLQPGDDVIITTISGAKLKP